MSFITIQSCGGKKKWCHNREIAAVAAVFQWKEQFECRSYSWLWLFTRHFSCKMTLWSTNLPLPWRDSTVYCNLGSSKQFLWACVWGCAFMICACQCRRVWVCKCRHESGMLSSLYWNLDFLRSVLEYSTKKIWQMIIKHHLGHSYLKLCKLWRGGGVVCWFCFVDSRRKKYCRINVFLISFF